MKTVSVIIPAYNEIARLKSTLEAIRGLNDVCEIIVVDDGSTDGTAEEAESAGADIVYIQPNSGKGAALRTGVGLASGEILLFLDADLGETAAEAAKLLLPVHDGSADMTIATFPSIPGKGGGVGLVVRLARRGIFRLTGSRMRAPLSGQRALTKSLIMTTGIEDGWGVEVGLTVRALWHHFKVVEVATEMTHRVTGRSAGAIVHRAQQFRAAWKTLNRLARELPKGGSSR